MALETLAQYGFSGLTLEKICSAARIPRATFYRRWSTPVELVVEAFNERFETGLLEEAGDLRERLIVFSDKLIALYADPVLGPCTAFMVTETRLKPEALGAVFEAQAMRRRHNRETLERALLAENRNLGLSARLILRTLNGLAYFSYSTGAPVDRDEFVQLIDKLLLPLPPRG